MSLTIFPYRYHVYDSVGGLLQRTRSSNCSTSSEATDDDAVVCYSLLNIESRSTMLLLDQSQRNVSHKDHLHRQWRQRVSSLSTHHLIYLMLVNGDTPIGRSKTGDFQT